MVGPNGWRERDSNVYESQLPYQYGNPSSSYFAADYCTFGPQGALVQRLRSAPEFQNDGYKSQGLAPWLLDVREYDAWGTLMHAMNESTQAEQAQNFDDPVGFGGQFGYYTDPSTALVLAGLATTSRGVCEVTMKMPGDHTNARHPRSSFRTRPAANSLSAPKPI